MTADDWKPWQALDEADAAVGDGKRHLRSAYAHNDADAQQAIERLQDAINQIDRAINVIEDGEMPMQDKWNVVAEYDDPERPIRQRNFKTESDAEYAKEQEKENGAERVKIVPPGEQAVLSWHEDY